jgi:hypothetical protein
MERQVEMVHFTQDTKNNELDICLKQMKESRDQLKETQLFQDYGYVLKKDLINVYLNKKKNKAYKSDEESDDDVLLLIQAPQGSSLEIP